MSQWLCRGILFDRNGTGMENFSIDDCLSLLDWLDFHRAR